MTETVRDRCAACLREIEVNYDGLGNVTANGHRPGCRAHKRPVTRRYYAGAHITRGQLVGVRETELDGLTVYPAQIRTGLRGWLQRLLRRRIQPVGVAAEDAFPGLIVRVRARGMVGVTSATLRAHRWVAPRDEIAEEREQKDAAPDRRPRRSRTGVNSNLRYARFVAKD